MEEIIFRMVVPRLFLFRQIFAQSVNVCGIKVVLNNQDFDNITYLVKILSH